MNEAPYGSGAPESGAHEHEILVWIEMIGGGDQFISDVDWVAHFAPDSQNLFEHDAGNGVGGNLMLVCLSKGRLNQGFHNLACGCHFNLFYKSEYRMAHPAMGEGESP